ncbi:thioredoxin-like protein [Clavulina sp. PMI_390]|nr:thioredoxin-like protein [Clavulina sp. PMI_390]
MATPSTSSPAAENGLVVHHLNNSRSLRVLWLLEELQVPYTVKHYQRDDNQQAPKELKEIHPLGKSPIVTDGDVTIAETGAIIEYLLHKYDPDRKFQPSEACWADNAYYTHFSEGSFMGNSTFSLVMTLAPSRAPRLFRPFAKRFASSLKSAVSEPALQKSLEMIETHLQRFSDVSNFAGGTNYTSADFMMIFPLEVSIKRRPQFVGKKTQAWVRKVQSLPSYKRAIERGGPYLYAMSDFSSKK